MRAPYGTSGFAASGYLNPGVSETGTLVRADFPNLKYLFEGKSPLSASNRNIVDPNLHSMYAQTWTFTVEHVKHKFLE